MTGNALVTADSEGPVRGITLQRREGHNALSLALQSATAGAIRAAGEDEGVACVVLRGADPALCVVASERARFGDTNARIGSTPAAGMSVLAGGRDGDR